MTKSKVILCKVFDLLLLATIMRFAAVSNKPYEKWPWIGLGVTLALMILWAYIGIKELEVEDESQA